VKRGDGAFLEAAELLLRARCTIAVTGAGISTPSGIPDFRSAHGLWTRYDIHEYGTIQAYHRDPYKVWQLFRAIGETVDPAEPNAAHRALAELEELGPLKAVVTQNIDRLHQRAGSRKVIEFHGSAQHFSCLSCRGRYGRDAALARRDGNGVPHCTCGYPLKPDIVLFGESIPPGALNESFAFAERSEVVLVAGTSATVAPASTLPTVVLGNGGTIIEMNLERTALSRHAAVRLTGDLVETLPKLVEAVRERLPGGV
jgi:NAD-dependent deacetylase